MKEKNGQNWRLLNLTTDLVFKIFFKENTHLLQELISDFLPFPEDSEIAGIELLDTEKNSQDIADPQEKTFILDLKVGLLRKRKGKDVVRETINVEVQTVAKKDFTNRMLAYSSRVYSGQVKVGQDYSELHPVYSLVFTTANLKEFASLKDKYYYHCQMQMSEPPHLVLTEGIQFVVVELGKFVKRLEKVLDRRDSWCYLIGKSEGMSEKDMEVLKTKGEVMGEAVKKLWNLSQDELVRERLEAIERQRRDRVAEIEYARDEGMERGMEKGIERGMEKGIERGIERGVEKGIEEGVKKIALAMMRMGVELDTIISATGLSKKELEKLGKDMKK